MRSLGYPYIKGYVNLFHSLVLNRSHCCTLYNLNFDPIEIPLYLKAWETF